MEDKTMLIEELKEKVRPTETIDAKVSVIIPLYGNFDSQRVKISIDSILEQEKVELEIILAEQSDRITGNLSKTDSRIKQVCIPNQVLMKGKYYLPGIVRNIAARSSNGEFLYNNDGDILFQSPLFLRRSLDLVEANKNIVLYRPPIRRLPMENFEEFKKLFEEKGLQLALNSLNRSGPYVATTFTNPVKMKVFRKNESGREKVFLYTETDHKKYREDSSNKGKEPLFSTLDTHAGGILMRRFQFDLVGGYSNFYAGWGCHDADLQWKLKGLFDLLQFPNFPEFEVLHLDHERGYFSQERWNKNREIQSRRRSQGVLKSVEEDLNDND